MSKTLIAYFSASGSTARVAEKLAKAANGQLFEIAPVKPYTRAELNWNDSRSRSSLEMADPACRPEIAGKVENMDQYDVVFIGFPIWWYVAPRIIQSFLESYDFSGKKLVLFATSGGSGMGDTEKHLRPCCSQSAQWLGARKLRGSVSQAELEDWVRSLGL